MAHGSDILRFDRFELDLTNRELRRQGAPVELGSRYFDALALLAAEPGTLITKDRFMAEVWRGIPVTDEALTQCIRSLRRALQDDAANPRFIQTVPKHGYRFLTQPGDDQQAELSAPNRLPGRVASASTIAGALAGALGGMFYGIFASSGGGETVVVLGALVAALGTLAGAGVGLGLAACLALRARADGWLVGGGAAGGSIAGALGGSLGRDGIGLLTSARLGPVTGIFEGLVIGLACGLAAWLVLSARTRGPVLLVGGAAAIGMTAGLIIHLVGGRLLAGSLSALQQELSDTRLDIGRLAQPFGQADLGGPSLAATTIAESGLFVVAVAFAMLFARRT